MAQRGHTGRGSPYDFRHRRAQGGVLSPLLSNLFLHYVLDQWFEQEVRPRLMGQAFLIRYADDFVIGVAREDDAKRIMEVLPERMNKYGLTVHPEKSRLVRFTPPEDDDSAPTAQKPSEPRTFDRVLAYRDDAATDIPERLDFDNPNDVRQLIWDQVGYVRIDFDVFKKNGETIKGPSGLDWLETSIDEKEA